MELVIVLVGCGHLLERLFDEPLGIPVMVPCTSLTGVSDAEYTRIPVIFFCLNEEDIYGDLGKGSCVL